MYLIRDKDRPDLYWQTQKGWGPKGSATVFTKEQLRWVQLPVDGEWWYQAMYAVAQDVQQEPFDAS